MRTITVLRSIITALIASLLVGSAAFAQSSAPPPDGITVIGQGRASAPADTVTLELVISSPDYGMPRPMVPGSTPGAQERDQVAPIVDALVSTGVPEGSIEVIVAPYLGGVFSTFGGPAIAQIIVTVESPSMDDLTGLVDAATVGAAESRVIVGGVNAMFVVEDCSMLRREARETAFANAQELASIQAEIVGVSTGDVVAVRDAAFGMESYSSFGMPPMDESCASGMQTNISGPLGQQTFDPGDTTDVTVFAITEVTFEINAGPVATPAP